MAATTELLPGQVRVMSDSSLLTSATTGPGSRVVVVTLPREIDVTNEARIREVLTEELCGGAAVLVADATGTAFCDCAGVGALTRAHQQAAAVGTQFRIAASSEIRHILKLTGADQVLDIYPALAAALDGG